MRIDYEYNIQPEGSVAGGMCLLARHFKKHQKKDPKKIEQRTSLVSRSYTGQNTNCFKESLDGFSVITLRLR